MPEEDVYLYAQWNLLPPTVDPTEPGDTCVTGEGAPGNTVEITDADGNVIGTGVINPDGTFEVCDLDPEDTGDIEVGQTDPDGNTSDKTHLYTVIYDTNGADSDQPMNQYIAEGEYVVNPGVPTKEFYSFIGWNTADNGTGHSWNFDADQMPAQNVILHAQWEIQAPTVEPVSPGDTCIEGEGVPGATIVITDDFGNVIREGVVAEDGHYSLCGEPIDNVDDINVVQTDKDGQVSPKAREHITYPAEGGNDAPVEQPVSKKSLANTGENIMEMLVVGVLVILVALFVIVNIIRRRK
jgi:uncharacterized repeat protein (TIGR02543 family)